MRRGLMHERTTTAATVGVALVAALCGAASTAAAGQIVAYELSDDHALVLDLPAGWSTSFVDVSRQGGTAELTLENPHQVSCSLSVYDVDRRLALMLDGVESYMRRGYLEPKELATLSYEDVVALYGRGEFARQVESEDLIVFEKGRKEVGGVAYSYWLHSPRRLWNGTETVDADGPIGTYLNGLAAERYRVRSSMSAVSGPGEARPRYVASLGGFDGLVSGLRIVPLAEASPFLRRTFDSDTSPISARGDYWLDMGVAITLPASWSAHEERVEAGGDREKGGYVARFAEPVESAEVPAFLLVVLVGLEATPHVKADFVATGDALVASLLGDDRQLVQREEIDFAPFFQLARLAPPRGESTGSTILSTWEGTGAESGRKVRIAVYTAGGLTAAANLLYVADAERFESVRPTIDEMLATMRIRVYSSSIRF